MSQLSKAMGNTGIHLYAEIGTMIFTILTSAWPSYLPVCRHVINHCLTSTQLLRILFASPRTQHALEASFGAWHGVLPRNLCYLGGLISNGVPLADGYLFMVVGYPMEVGTIPLKDADS